MQLPRNKHWGNSNLARIRQAALLALPPAAPMLGLPRLGATRSDGQGQGADGAAALQASDYEDLLACGRGELFGAGKPQLPLPPMLMFDRISEIAEAGGEYGKGLVRAVLELKPDLWFFPCHFKGDPVMPGCLGLDALWQLLGFFLGWLGSPGKGRALGTGRGEVLRPGAADRQERRLRHRHQARDALASWCSASPTAGCRRTARSSTARSTSRSACSATRRCSRAQVDGAAARRREFKMRTRQS